MSISYYEGEHDESTVTVLNVFFPEEYLKLNLHIVGPYFAMEKFIKDADIAVMTVHESKYTVTYQWDDHYGNALDEWNRISEFLYNNPVVIDPDIRWQYKFDGDNTFKYQYELI